MKDIPITMLVVLVFVFALGHSEYSAKKFDVAWRVVFRTIGFKTAGKAGKASLQIIGRGPTNTKYYDLTVGRGVTSHTLITNYIGEPTHVKVFFRGGSNTWNLQQIEISRNDDVYQKYIFHCRCWVNFSSTKILPVSNPMWIVTVFTRNKKDMYTNRLWVKITGTEDVSRKIYIDDKNLRTGRKVTQVKHTKVIGSPKAIQLGHETDEDGRFDVFLLDKIEIQRGEIQSKNKYVFNFNGALHENYTRTIYLSNPLWRVSVKTADYDENSGTDDGVYIELVGTEGTSSLIGLTNPYRNKFDRNSWDHFSISTKVIGEIKGVELGTRGND